MGMKIGVDWIRARTDLLYPQMTLVESMRNDCSDNREEEDDKTLVKLYNEPPPPMRRLPKSRYPRFEMLSTLRLTLCRDGYENRLEG